jgi:hypothetical protein
VRLGFYAPAALHQMMQHLLFSRLLQLLAHSKMYEDMHLRISRRLLKMPAF